MSTSTRERIVTAMAELLRHQGYRATSVKQVAAAAGAPMGSLYHHFPGGKLQIAAAALRTSGAAYIELLPLLMDPHDDLRAAVPAFFEAAAQDIEQTGWANMCPVGTVGGETADSVPALREVVAEVVGSWLDQGTAYLVSRGLAPDHARSLTLAMLGALEGAFVLSRALRSADPLRAAGAALTPQVRELVTAGARTTATTV